jgi:hypothetical protein
MTVTVTSNVPFPLPVPFELLPYCEAIGVVLDHDDSPLMQAVRYIKTPEDAADSETEAQSDSECYSEGELVVFPVIGQHELTGQETVSQIS